MRTGARDVLSATTLAAALLVTAGCTGSDEALQPRAETSMSGAASGTVARTLRIGLTEWTVIPAAPEVPPGRVELTVTNAGATEHDLVVRGRMGQWHTPDLDPGEHAELSIRTVAGETLELWCAEPGHRAQGMSTTLDVGRT